LLVHDHVLLRQGLRRLLEDEPDIDVVSEAGNAAECLRKLHEFQPDVLIADAETFERPAPEVAHLVDQESPHTRIVFLSGQEQGTSLFSGLQAANRGCAVRQTSAAEFVELVRRSASGGAPYSISTSPEEALSRRPQKAAFPPERMLTAREREVLKLLAEGKTVRSAAMVLGLSSKTVDAHKFNLMRKLSIHNKAELVMWAIQRKVVKIPANF
jgi:DNA-binding NarL/FixJ family response regulator